jgi:hypothetical protein
MKKTALFIVALCISSFTVLQESHVIENQSEDFTWLLGSWQRVNDPEGKQTFEHWEKSTDGLYKGIGCTLKDGDTLWKESIKLKRVGQDWHFEVLGQKASKPTVFIVTEIGGSSFICENEANEFPKKIEYKWIESELKATISGGADKVDFNFKRIP